MAAKTNSLSVTFFIKLNLIRWRNAAINAASFHPNSFFSIKQLNFHILKLVIKYG